jgi:hypothetical protein
MNDTAGGTARGDAQSAEVDLADLTRGPDGGRRAARRWWHVGQWVRVLVKTSCEVP